ncbi:MAG: hypothetical protein HZA94_00975 [Candidatus Vogelbacteria bacterium]|nr:hypothetical protein [Candidatus Vogelbacteria bacterium]
MPNEEINKDSLTSSIAITVATIIIFVMALSGTRGGAEVSSPGGNRASASLGQAVVSEGDVLPSSGVVLPIIWGDLGARLVKEGVIDASKLEEIYAGRGGLGEEEKKLLFGDNPDRAKITKDNAPYLLNLLWALGLSSKNPVLDSGEMMSSGDASNFASTGGWTVSKGSPMDHYSKHKFFDLTSDQQALVGRVSRNIYRPCCGNSTHFPDCNHGMAMLGLLELMASQGVSEDEMYKAALAVNSYWFPDTYLTIATYMQGRGIDWADVSPREVLGFDYSSGGGFAKIKSAVTKPDSGGASGGGCSV